jgi:transposase, IS30 family
LVERKSGYALVGYIPRATKEAFRQETERLLAPLPSHLKRSLTLDNGTKMTDYEALERRAGIQVYFAHPYHSWERGINENFNGLLRQYFPKKAFFSMVAPKAG